MKTTKEQKKLQHDVLVRKDIKLATNESVHDFTQALSNDVRKFVRQKLNLDVTKSDVYVMDVFSKSAVVEVFKFGPNIDSVDRRRFFAMAFTRKDTGTFEFSNTVEVERVTSFREKKTSVLKTAVMKNADAEVRDDLADDTPKCDGWITMKQFWGGVL